MDKFEDLIPIIDVSNTFFFYDKFDAFMVSEEGTRDTMMNQRDTGIVTMDPVTDEEITLPADVESGEIVDSPVSGAELEVVSVDPVTLEEAPELEEDWGE